MKKILALIVLSALNSCEPGPAESGERNEEEVIYPAVDGDALFDDIVFTKEILFPEEILGVKTVERCELHRTPIYDRTGFRPALHVSRDHSFFRFISQHPRGDLAPNPGPWDILLVNFVDESELEFTEPYSATYCLACRHVYDLVEARFFNLPAEEREELIRQVRAEKEAK